MILRSTIMRFAGIHFPEDKAVFYMPGKRLVFDEFAAVYSCNSKIEGR